jgi:predicted dehydrogenase/threonine dehydrogenase-like Zn-dependent dehydrogenase
LKNVCILSWAKMKQILQSYKTGELWLAQTPIPACKSNGILVRTGASLVSAGTERMLVALAKKSLICKAKARPDLVKKVLAKIKTEGLLQTMQNVFSKLDTPIALGYSIAGTVLEVGLNVSGFKPGEQVACGGAGYATHADYNYVPKNLCVKIPDGVSFEDASFTTVGAIAMQGVRQADVRIGERIVVIGLGLIGLLTVQILKACGCKVLGMDLDPGKCTLARDLGANDAVSANLIETSEAFSWGYGADAVIITAATKSNKPIEEAAEISRMKGRIVVVGMVRMDVPREAFYKKELELRLSMSYGPGRYDRLYEEHSQDYPFGYVRWTEQRNMQSFLELVADAKVTPGRLITHRFTIDEGLKAYELLAGSGDYSKPQTCLGIVINYTDTASDQNPAPAAPVRQHGEKKIELRTISACTDNKIGIGFIGAGNFVKAVLLPALKRIDNVNLIGLCTATGMSGTETGKKYGFAYATTDYQQLLTDELVNTIFIATQHDTHARFACEALSAGKNVFVEKPLCLKPEDLENYKASLQSAAAEGHSPVLMVGFNRRFSRHAIALKKVFASRRSPLVITYRINAGVIPEDSWIQNPESGGGRIIGEVCHFVDFCEFVTGSVPIRVFADCIASGNNSIHPEDSVVITISYADGSLSAIQYLAVGSSRLPKERVEVYADRISAVMDNFTRTVFFTAKCRPIKGRQDKGFDAELNAFIETIHNGGQWPIPFESFIRTTKVTFAAIQSLRSGKVISLNGQETIPESSVENSRTEIVVARTPHQLSAGQRI